MAANLSTNDSSFVKMVILTADCKKKPLTRTEANEIEKYIFDEIYASSGKRPHFRGGYVFSEDDGAIIIDTHVDSVSWLKEVVGSYKQKALTITDIKNSPQYTAKVRADVSKLDMKAVHNLFELLETHNYGLQTNSWRVSSIGPTIYQLYGPYVPLGISSITFLIDDPGRKILERNDFKLFVGFSTITFTLLGRVKRSETTDIICKDDV